MKLYWYAKWGTPSDVKRNRDDGALILSNDRLEKNMASVYEKGKKDGAYEHERAGAVNFGQELYALIDQWTPAEGAPDHVKPLVPAWALEQLLNDWNIPRPEGEA